MVVIYCYLERENYIIGIIPLTVKEAPLLSAAPYSFEIR